MNHDKSRLNAYILRSPSHLMYRDVLRPIPKSPSCRPIILRQITHSPPHPSGADQLRTEGLAGLTKNRAGVAVAVTCYTESTFLFVYADRRS